MRYVAISTKCVETNEKPFRRKREREKQQHTHRKSQQTAANIELFMSKYKTKRCSILDAVLFLLLWAACRWCRSNACSLSHFFRVYTGAVTE